MHALPLLIALAVAALLARPLLGLMRSAGSVRRNYRGVELASPFGALVPVAALLALVPVALLQRLAGGVLRPGWPALALYVLGVAILGLLDDLLGGERRDGAAPPRGVRGHARATLAGELSTGAVKAVGTLGLALLSCADLGLSERRWLLAAAVLVLATHAFNLLDVRPGRAVKALVLLGAGLSAGTREVRPLWSLGLFAGPALVAGVCDLRERAMLGDTGAGVLGALAGLWLVLALPAAGQLAALAALALLALYGELRSLSALIERTPGLRELDSWGRPS